MALTVSLAKRICNEMNNSDDDCFKYVMEQALIEICRRNNVSYIKDSYVGYQVTDGILH